MATASIEPSLQRPLPPAGPYFYDPTAGKEYRWKVRFDPCPRGGRDVVGC